MPLQGLTTSTGERLVVSAGGLYIANTQRGILDGPVTFDPGTEIDNGDFAGKTNPIDGLDRPIRHAASLSVSFKEIDDTLLGLLMPGSTTVTASGVVTRTPPAAGVFLTSINNVRAIFLLGNQTYYEIRFPKAMPRRGTVTGGFPQFGSLSATFEARSLASTPDVAPFTEHFYGAPIPTL